MVLDLEYYFDPLWFRSSMHVGCVALYISFPKYPRSSKSKFGAKKYGHFSGDSQWPDDGPDAGLDAQVQSQVESPVSVIFTLERPDAGVSLVSDDRTRPVSKKHL
jgi:hypothetical protein